MMHFLSILLTGVIFSTPTDPTLDIIVSIENIKDIKGTIYVAVYEDPANFPDDLLWTNRIAHRVNGEKETIILKDMQALECAIAVYHDVNDNMKMDKNWIGIPKEPYGFSNNAIPKWSPPKYEDCKMKLSSDNSSFTIRLIH